MPQDEAPPEIQRTCEESDRDRDFFAANPDRRFLLRPAYLGETALHDGRPTLTFVEQLKPGVRIRLHVMTDTILMGDPGDEASLAIFERLTGGGCQRSELRRYAEQLLEDRS
jgi:hypothetical protein